jgi:hypothetical protein
MLPDSVRSQLLVRTLWAGLQHPELTHQQARELAAQQLAEEQAAQQQHHKPRTRQKRAADATDLASAPQALLHKVLSLLDRVHDRQHKPKPKPTPQLAELDQPPEPPAPTLGERISGKLADLAEAVGITQPEPEPPPKQFSLFASSDGIVREIAPDESPHLTSEATRNYRRSTTQNVVSFEEKRGGTPAGKSWLIG